MFYRFRYFRQARSLNLPSAEKEVVRHELQEFMATHPVRVAESARLLQQRSNLLKPALGFATVLLLLGAGTASAAEQALPDNTPLYFIKTNINEPIRRTLALTPEAKADVEATLATRRLEETETLAASGRLNVHIQQHVEDRLVKQVEKAQEHISKLNKEGKSRTAKTLNAKLEASLQAHEKHLTDLGAVEASTRTTLAPIIKRLQAKGEDNREERKSIDKNEEKKQEEKKKTNTGRSLEEREQETAPARRRWLQNPFKTHSETNDSH